MDNRVREVRHEKKMTVKEVVEKLEYELNYKITESHFTNIENGRIGFSVSFLIAFAKLFNVSTDYILKISNIKERE